MSEIGGSVEISSMEIIRVRRCKDLLFLMSIFLIPVGIIMIAKPHWIWSITEEWKSNDATEPSDLYLVSTRIGGVFMTLAGLGALIAFWFL